jgi:hypothetical protein
MSRCWWAKGSLLCIRRSQCVFENPLPNGFSLNVTGVHRAREVNQRRSRCSDSLKGSCAEAKGGSSANQPTCWCPLRFVVHNFLSALFMPGAILFSMLKGKQAVAGNPLIEVSCH